MERARTKGRRVGLGPGLGVLIGFESRIGSEKGLLGRVVAGVGKSMKSETSSLIAFMKYSSLEELVLA